jgi:hypothetical protein
MEGFSLAALPPEIRRLGKELNRSFKSIKEKTDRTEAVVLDN